MESFYRVRSFPDPFYHKPLCTWPVKNKQKLLIVCLFLFTFFSAAHFFHLFLFVDYFSPLLCYIEGGGTGTLAAFINPKIGYQLPICFNKTIVSARAAKINCFYKEFSPKLKIFCLCCFARSVCGGCHIKGIIF